MQLEMIPSPHTKFIGIMEHLVQAMLYFMKKQIWILSLTHIKVEVLLEALPTDLNTEEWTNKDQVHSLTILRS